MNAQPLKEGDECPHCHYSPLYEDECGDLVCIGCDRAWQPNGSQADTLDGEEDDAD